MIYLLLAKKIDKYQYIPISTISFHGILTCIEVYQQKAVALYNYDIQTAFES